MKVKVLTGEQKQKLLGKLIERFGFPAGVFDEYEFYLLPEEIKICAQGVISAVENIPNIYDAGFTFAKLGVNVKPSTQAVQIFGKFAKKNIIELNFEEAVDFISGRDFYPTASTENCTNGFVIVRFKEDNLGPGFLRGNQLKNLVPGAKRLEI
ncbi:MAG: hypothetical protein V1839_04120 [archaeon]